MECLLVRLSSKNLILLKARRGYVMCGYLNIRVAEKFGDAAAVVRGVSTILQAVDATVAECTRMAKRLGVRKGQPVRETLALLG